MKLPVVSLRPAVEEDLFQILSIEKQSTPQPWGIESFKEELERPLHEFWVLTDDETDSQVFAYLIFIAYPEHHEILNIAVHPQHRRRGLGKQLLGKLVSESMRKKSPKLLLEVRRSNEAAIQLYQLIGFSIIQVRKSFYSNGEDAFTMELNLDGASNAIG